MNYEARIAKLKAKGILDDKDANLLETTLKQKMSTLPKKRRYLLETIGLLLLGAMLLYLSIQIGSAGEDSGIEDVSQTLNGIRAGVSTSHTFLLLLAGFVTAAFVGFYLLVQHYYNVLWRIQEGMTATGTLIADLEARQSQINETLQQFVSHAQSSKRSANTAIEVTAELDRELGELQRMYTALQVECRQKRRVFPYTLAAMAGKLPECQ